MCLPLKSGEMTMQTSVLPSLSGLSLQVTDACNLACSYCYFREKEPISISDETVSKALDLLERESTTSKAWHINFFGGEPTLFPHLLESIAGQTRQRASRLGKTATFSMTTNGTRFDDQMSSLVKTYNISTLLSLDGNRKAHDAFRVYHSGKGSFDDIIKNLDRLKSAQGFSVRMTISVRSLPYLAESITELVELGIDSIATSVVAEDVWTEEAYEQFGEEWLKVAALALSYRLQGKRLRLKGLSADYGVESQCKSHSEYGCGAATTFLFVDAKGDLYPCHRYPGYFNKSPNVRLGSVFGGINRERRERYVAANKSSAKQGCSSFAHPSQLSGPCAQCGIQSACGGSCMAINENATGDPTRPPPVIGRIKHIMLAVQEQVDEYWHGMSSEEASNGRRQDLQTG
jgi:uncharacterized protein